MSYHMQLVLTNSLLILKSTVKGSTLMSCIDHTSCYYNIVANKIAKVDTHRYHTIQNIYCTACEAFRKRH